MPSGPLHKFTAKAAGDVCARFELSDAGRALLKPGVSPGQFLDLLIEKQIFDDATRFMAHGLPKRESVWWACVVARVLNDAKSASALTSAEKWVSDPSEENRQATMPAAEKVGFGTPAGCAALAAFFSGGSLGPPNVAPIPPAETLTGDAVAGALMLAVVQKEPEKAPQKYKDFLGRGIDIANGKNVWK